MVKSITQIVAVMFAAAILTSCGGSIESDAKKLAKLLCEGNELEKKGLSGDESAMQESLELASEAVSLGLELRGKYTSADDKKEFTQALLKEMGKCD